MDVPSGAKNVSYTIGTLSSNYSPWVRVTCRSSSSRGACGPTSRDGKNKRWPSSGRPASSVHQYLRHRTARCSSVLGSPLLPSRGRAPRAKFRRAMDHDDEDGVGFTAASHYAKSEDDRQQAVSLLQPSAKRTEIKSSVMSSNVSDIDSPIYSTDNLTGTRTSGVSCFGVVSEWFGFCYGNAKECRWSMNFSNYCISSKKNLYMKFPICFPITTCAFFVLVFPLNSSLF